MQSGVILWWSYPVHKSDKTYYFLLCFFFNFHVLRLLCLCVSTLYQVLLVKAVKFVMEESICSYGYLLWYIRPLSLLIKLTMKAVHLPMQLWISVMIWLISHSHWHMVYCFLVGSGNCNTSRTTAQESSFSTAKSINI